MTSWHTYPKIYSLGHAAISDLLFDEVLVEEKVDGSQFSFGSFNGELKCRSKGQEILIDNPEKMFRKAVEVVLSLKDKLIDGYTYRAEYLQKPKHNVLCYDRIPNNHLSVFDINTAQEKYLPYAVKEVYCRELGLECIPQLAYGKISDIGYFQELLNTTSCLGGQKIEGVVIKNYSRFATDGKALMGKHVSEAFKEIHKREWKIGNPGQLDIIQILQSRYRTPARWDKALIHLKERGLIANEPKDIGLLTKEVATDSETELKELVMADLYEWGWPKLRRTLTHGLAEWYKIKLAEKQFAAKD